MLKEISKYHKEWLKVAFKYLKSKQDAEDEVQNMYVKIQDKLIKGELTPEKIAYKDTINKHFIYKVIRNSCIDILRKKKTFVNIDSLKDELLYEIEIDNQIDNDRYSLIEVEINKLPKTDKAIFNLRLKGLTIRNIAYITEKSNTSIVNSLRNTKRLLNQKCTKI